jgi:multicomponent Na+:H+ antiporter subunit D
MNKFLIPSFVAIPLITAFILPLFGKKGKGAATIFANIVAIVMLVLSMLSIGRSGVYMMGKWPIPLGINLVLDGLSSLFLLAISVVGFAVMLYSSTYMERYTAKSRYLSLLVLLITGLNGAVLSGDFFNLFVFLEIASLASYALVGFGCGHEELEASFKYTVIGSIGATLLLFAVALVYGNTGSLNMAYVAQSIQKSGTINNGLAFALVLFVVGFAIKAALVPFHTWLPDAHQSAPAPVSAILSGVLIKSLGVYTLCRIIFSVFGVTLSLGWILIVLGILSMVTGALLGLRQWDLKRLMAYSSVSQIGYVLLGIGLGAVLIAQKANPAWISLALLGGLFHFINHSVYKALLFLTSGSVEMATGIRDLRKLGGLAERMPFTRATCAIASASIAGVPPFSGFWSKLILVIAAISAGYYWIAAILIAVSLCTLIMYLKVHRYVFLGQLPENLKDVKENKGAMLFAMVFLACLCVSMGLVLIIPEVRQHVLEPAVTILTNGVQYSQTVIEQAGKLGVQK